MSKIRIDIEEIFEICERRKTINKLDLADIEFCSKGIPLNIDPKVTEEFSFTGLNNIDFITSNYYLKEHEDYLEVSYPSKVSYICGDCLTPFPVDICDENGNCIKCHADNWLEERDFGHNPGFVKSLVKEIGVDKQFLKSMFKLECILAKRTHLIFRNPATGLEHSYPIG